MKKFIIYFIGIISVTIVVFNNLNEFLNNFRLGDWRMFLGFIFILVGVLSYSIINTDMFIPKGRIRK